MIILAVPYYTLKVQIQLGKLFFGGRNHQNSDVSYIK